MGVLDVGICLDTMVDVSPVIDCSGKVFGEWSIYNPLMSNLSLGCRCFHH